MSLWFDDPLQVKLTGSNCEEDLGIALVCTARTTGIFHFLFLMLDACGIWESVPAVTCCLKKNQCQKVAKVLRRMPSNRNGMI